MRIIYAGEIKIQKDPRLNLIGNNLIINQLMEEDAGEYVCQLEIQGELVKQVHTVNVIGTGCFAF